MFSEYREEPGLHDDETEDWQAGGEFTQLLFIKIRREWVNDPFSSNVAREKMKPWDDALYSSQLVVESNANYVKGWWRLGEAYKVSICGKGKGWCDQFCWLLRTSFNNKKTEKAQKQASALPQSVLSTIRSTKSVIETTTTTCTAKTSNVLNFSSLTSEPTEIDGDVSHDT